MSGVQHEPVLVAEALRYLEPERGGLFVDGTVGLGGHAAALLEAGPRARLLGVDRDPEALERAAERLAPYGERVRLVEATFSELADVLAGERVDGGILADLGVSSLQLDLPQRGFAFRFADAPLDMRMGRGALTAAEVVNEYEENELMDILRRYGEEPAARRIARAVVARRRERPFTTTGELRDLIHQVKGGRRAAQVDPATLSFQALRIEVNRELAELERLLEEVPRLLADDGRIVILSYHSLEDRLVKHRFRELARGVPDPVTGRPREETRLLELLTRRAVRPGPEEVAANPRARSARLRAARRIGPA